MPAASEAPRAVYAAGCAAISLALAAAGYRYSPSGFKCSKRSGDFTYEIQMSSSVYNVAGEHVLLSICGSAKSRRFKKWKIEAGLHNPTDHVSSGQLGYLGAEHLYLEWDLADPATRPAVVQGAIDAIREFAFPWFAQFEDVPALCRQLIDRDVPMFDVVCAINFLMCFAGRDAATAAGRSFLVRRPDLVETYKQELRLRRDLGPLRIRGVGYARELAIVSRFFELGELA